MQYEVKKFIDFIITQKCTYKCPYCSQSKLQALKQLNADKNTINSFYKLLDNIEKDFEITITGGEAILHPDFFNIIKNVKQKGFKINLITNLSTKIEKYLEIFDVLDNCLNYFDISFHLNQIHDFDLILNKVQELIKNKPDETKIRFFIPIYLIDKKAESKIEKIVKLAKNNNIEFEFQKIRFLNKYKKEQNKKYASKFKISNNFAKLCHAGSKSLVIYENGNAYRCYSSRFIKSNYLGNINDENFEIFDNPRVCTMNSCTCPKPYCYNQILNEADYKTAIKTSFNNAINLPRFILKNKDVIITKIKQNFNF